MVQTELRSLMPPNQSLKLTAEAEVQTRDAQENEFFMAMCRIRSRYNSPGNTDRIIPGRGKTNSGYPGCCPKPYRNIRHDLLFLSGKRNRLEIMPRNPSGPDHLHGHFGSLAVCKGSRR